MNRSIRKPARCRGGPRRRVWRRTVDVAPHGLSRRRLLASVGLCLLIVAPDRPSRAAEAATTGTAVSGILQSRHNLSLAGEPPCRFCHLAREAATPVKPRWDSGQDTASFPSYSGAGPEPEAKWQPQGVSLVCLSCHDGTLGPDRVLDTATGELGWTPIRLEVGTLFISDHPISVAYARARPGGFNGAHDGRVGSLPLYGDRRDRIECASCHNPHSEALGVFLRAAAAQGRLCRTCHIK